MIFDDREMFRYSGVELPFLSRTGSSASVFSEIRKYPCYMRVTSSLKFKGSLIGTHKSDRGLSHAFLNSNMYCWYAVVIFLKHLSLVAWSLEFQSR